MDKMREKAETVLSDIEFDDQTRRRVLRDLNMWRQEERPDATDEDLQEWHDFCRSKDDIGVAAIWFTNVGEYLLHRDSVLSLYPDIEGEIIVHSEFLRLCHPYAKTSYGWL